MMELGLAILFIIIVVGAVTTIGDALDWIGEHVFRFPREKR